MIKAPQHYLEEFLKARELFPLYKEMKIEKHTSVSEKWGWYEIYPIGAIVGFWDTETGEDDLRGVDIAQWNLEAMELVKETIGDKDV